MSARFKVCGIINGDQDGLENNEVDLVPRDVGKGSGFPGWDLQVDGADVVRARIFGEFPIKGQFVAQAPGWTRLWIPGLGHPLDLRSLILGVSQHKVWED